MTTHKNSIFCKCYMHGCTSAVTKAVPLEACVRWIASDHPVPNDLSPAETRRLKAEFKESHMKAPKPKELAQAAAASSSTGAA